MTAQLPHDYARRMTSPGWFSERGLIEGLASVGIRWIAELWTKKVDRLHLLNAQ